MNLYAYVGNDPVNSIDPSGTRTEILEEDIYALPPVTTTNNCGCEQLVGLAARAWVEGMQNSQKLTSTAISLFILKPWAMNENDSPEENSDVQEEYDSIEAAVGSVNPLDEVEYEGKTKNSGLSEQGFTEKWTGVDSNDEFQSAFRNPKTGKWTGGHYSSKNGKYW